MSLQGLSRPCKAAAVLAVLATASFPSAGAAACRKFSIWKYPYPQRCTQTVVAVLPPERSSRPVPEEQISTVALPLLNFDYSQEGDEKLKGIGLLREIQDAR